MARRAGRVLGAEDDATSGVTVALFDGETGLPIMNKTMKRLDIGGVDADTSSGYRVSFPSSCVHGKPGSP